MKEFYCYRCNRYKKLELLSDHVSPTGLKCCITCQNNHIPRGTTLNKLAKRSTKNKEQNASYMASLVKQGKI